MADETLASCLEALSAVFILGGDIMPAQNREHLEGLGWRSLEGLEKDKTGPMPSYERVKAGSCLYRMNPRLLLIPSGGKSNLPTAGHSPLIATVMAAELRELGVPSTAIIEETQSFTTQDHFVHCSAIARARGWKSAEIGILAPFWQFGRITAMMMVMRAEQYGSIDPFVLGVTPLISVERARLVATAEEDRVRAARGGSVHQGQLSFRKISSSLVLASGWPAPICIGISHSSPPRLNNSGCYGA